MKELYEFLNEREIYILESYPQKTLKALGKELGISDSRVCKIRNNAKRRIRDQKREEQEKEVAPISFSRLLQRRDAWVLLRALENYNECIQKEWRVDEKPHWVELEPDYAATQMLMEEFRQALKQPAPVETMD